MIIIAAGSNLPFQGVDSEGVVLNAFFALERANIKTRLSPLYKTPAWPDPSDPPFVNAVALAETSLSPEALLAALHGVEAGFGRRRDLERNAPRTLDLDLIAYHAERRPAPGEAAVGGLILPHPRLQDREFVLAPLCDLAPDWRHPVLGRTAQTMLDALETRGARRIG